MRLRILRLIGCSRCWRVARAEDPMMNTYDNTVTTKNVATGESGSLLFNKDMTYIAKGRGQGWQAGRISRFTGRPRTMARPSASRPLAAGREGRPKPSCSPLMEHKSAITGRSPTTRTRPSTFPSPPAANALAEEKRAEGIPAAAFFFLFQYLIKPQTPRVAGLFGSRARCHETFAEL